jgi:hypothetical protein
VHGSETAAQLTVDASDAVDAPERDVDAWPSTGALRHGVLPLALRAPTHDEEVAVAEPPPLRGAPCGRA